MNKKIKSVLINFIFISLCFLTFGASLYYFFTDLNSVTLRSDKQIAFVQFKKKIAQRKFSDSVVWERLQEKSPLYNEDIIRTENDAAATMTFEKGAVIDLDEKSMIQIFEGKNGELKISVSGGNFSVDTTDSASVVKIDLGNGTLVNLEKGSRLSATNNNGISSINIQRGTGSLSNSDGKEDVILAGDSVKIEADGNRVKIPVSVKNFDSTQKILVFEGQKKNLDFEFNVDPQVKNNRLIFEKSSDSDFNLIDEQYFISDEKLYLSVEKGIFYYRVYAENYFDLAQKGKVIVDEIKTPRLISPNDGAVFESSTSNSVSFIWNSGAHSDFSRIEIFDSNDIINPIITQDVNDVSCKIDGLTKGKYFWKIIPHYSVNEIGFNDTLLPRSFQIIQQKPKLTPELALPPNNANIALSDNDKNVLFAYKTDEEIPNVKIEISSTKDFSNNIIYSVLSNSKKQNIPLNIEKFPEGKYFWRAIKIAENQKEYPSEINEFSVTKFVPKTTQLIFPPDDYNVELSRLLKTQFVWSISENIEKLKTQSVIEIATDENFSNVIKEINTTGISFTGINIPQGKYFWRVRSINTEDNLELAKTACRKLIVLNELSSPKILSPAKNKLSVFDGTAIVINWQSVPEADFYNVTLIDEKTEQVINYFNSVKENSVRAVLPFDKKIKVTVMACTEEKENSPARKSQITQTDFQVYKLTKIKLSYPSNNQSIDGLFAVRKNIVFRWAEDSSSKDKEFILTKLNSNGTSSIVYSEKNPKDSVSIKRLKPGKYRWTVKASNNDGVVFTPDVESFFTVTEIPLLQKVKIEKPERNFVIDIPYLKNNRTITFNWKPVPFATDYEFTLYQKNANGTLRKILSQTLKGTTYTISDLTKLDVGKFEWHVKAFSFASDGFEEQRSPEAVSSFEINFDLPKAVKTKIPGRMYAQ